MPLISVLGLPDPDAVHEYINDTEADWGIDPYDAVFRMKKIRLTDLERARIRPLLLRQVNMEMVGQTRTKGPMVLDKDYSVIDGMHRLADAIARGDTMIEAYVRVP